VDNWKPLAAEGGELPIAYVAAIMSFLEPLRLRARRRRGVAGAGEGVSGVEAVPMPAEA